MLTKINIQNGNHFFIGSLLSYNSIFKVWSIEHYSKCSFRCAYCCCDSQGKSIPTESPDTIIQLLEEDIQSAIDANLFTKGSTRVIISCHTDPYVDIEKELLLTRNIIHYLGGIRQPFSIVTRGDLIERDFDLLRRYREISDVSFSLPIINPFYIKKFEPHVPPIKQRIKIISAAYEAGINVTVRIVPWIPEATDVEAILKCFSRDIDVLISPLMLSDVINNGGVTNESDETIPATYQQGGKIMADKFISFAQHGFCQTATKLFSHLSQEDINSEYIKERNRIGFRQKVKWFYPPIPGKNINEIAYRFLKPDELSPEP